MGLLSPLTTTSDETSPDIIEPSPVNGVKTTESSEQKSNEKIDPSIVLPSSVSQSSQEENAMGRDGDCNNDNTWKGDSWSQDHVRIFPFQSIRVFLDIANNACLSHIKKLINYFYSPTLGQKVEIDRLRPKKSLAKEEAGAADNLSRT